MVVTSQELLIYGVVFLKLEMETLTDSLDTRLPHCECAQREMTS